MMQVLEQSIKATGGLDQAKLADYMHTYEFDTFVGKVRFAKNGEWAQPRMLTVQYHGIAGNDLEQWMKPGQGHHPGPERLQDWHGDGAVPGQQEIAP